MATEGRDKKQVEGGQCEKNPREEEEGCEKRLVWIPEGKSQKGSQRSQVSGSGGREFKGESI